MRITLWVLSETWACYPRPDPGTVAGLTILTRCNVLSSAQSMLTGCSCSLFPGQCWWQGPARARDTHDMVSRQCHESARMSCCHESDRHLWCLLVSQHCILSLHLPTSTLTWYNTRYSLSVSPNIYIRMCVHQIPVIVSRENVCLDNCLFIYTLPCTLDVSTIPT